MERTKPSNGRFATNSELVSRAALAAALGMQYGGDRNVYQALGYEENEITYAQYASRYERQDIAKAVINRPISYTWKGPIKLHRLDSENTPIELAWKELDKQLKLRSKFVRLDKLSSIGQYGTLLFGFDDTNSPESFMNPVRVGRNLKLLYVKPLGEGHARIKSYVKNTRDPRYGLPEMYEIEYSEAETSTSVIRLVHWTRMLHVTTELLESEIYGTPVLKSIWNRLYDLEKLIGGSAEMFWRGARPGYQGKIKEDYTLPDSVAEGLEAQLNEWENNLRRVFVNEGVDLEALATQVSDPINHVDVQLQMISAVTGIPKRILVGSERGELSSAQDMVGWFTHIQTRREEHAEVNILRPFVDRCMEYGILPMDKEYVVEWSDLFASSEKDKAEVGRTRAMAIREYTQNPVAEAIVPPKAFFEYFLGLTPDQIEGISNMTNDEMIEELRSIAEQYPPPGRTGPAGEGEEGDNE
jgi:hypothetical protein